MTDERYRFLMNDELAGLTHDEVKEGWHFCSEWDGLLVGPGCAELSCCHCWPQDNAVYKTIPPEEQGDFNEPPDTKDPLS